MISIAVVLGLMLRAVAGGSLLFAGFAKFQLEAKVRTSIMRSYRVIPSFAVDPLVWLLPITEVILGAALIAGIALPTSSIVASIVLFSATVVLGSALVRKLRIKCGCFGSNRFISWPLMIRNLILIAMALSIGRVGIDGPNVHSLAPPIQVAIVAAIGIAVAVVAMLAPRRTYSTLQTAYRASQ